MGDREDLSGETSVSSHTAHLLGQISFLHKELERLENQLQSVRTKGVSSSRELREHYERIIFERNAEIQVHLQTIKSKECRESELVFEIDHLQSIQKELEQEKILLRSRISELEKKQDTLSSVAGIPDKSGIDVELHHKAIQVGRLESSSERSCGNEGEKQIEQLLLTQLGTVKILEENKLRLSQVVRENEEIKREYEMKEKSLEQKLSQALDAQRVLLERLAFHGEEKQQSDISHKEAEQNRILLESQLYQYERDVDHLIKQRNLTAEQLKDLSVENESLHAQIHHLLEKETAAKFSLQAKVEEVNDALDAYRSASKENETLIEKTKIMEREIDSLQGSLSSKEEGIIFFRHQLHVLNMREQQLILDLQSFEYDNDQLHRRLLHSDSHAGQLEDSIRDLQQTLHAKELSIEELHQGLAELSKQIVVKENEVTLLRQNYSSLEGEQINLQATVARGAAKLKEVGEANARLVTREVLRSSQCTLCASHENKTQDLTIKVNTLQSDLELLKKQLSLEHSLRERSEKELISTQVKLRDADDSKQRLQKVIFDQTKTLSSLAK